MTPRVFSILFVFFVVMTLGMRLWLGLRHVRHIRRHRENVPTQFESAISIDAHQKAADYTTAKTRFSLMSAVFDAFLLLVFTLGGGLQALYVFASELLPAGLILQVGFLVIFACLLSMISLPLDYYSQFVLEEKFGFNRMTPKLFLIDQCKGALLGAIIGLPMLFCVLALMAKAGALWWLYAWILLSVFQLVMMMLYPTVIAPMFNQFTPLDDEHLRDRIEHLMARVGFASKGLFVMDGSKRSAHGNAYFSGFGAAKRIVFFDTLLARLAPNEVEAVLAHELGHFKLKHTTKQLAVMMVSSCLLFAVLGFVKTQSWFYAGLGVAPELASGGDAMALLLFSLAFPLVIFFLSPMMSMSSRKHEYEADAFAARYTSAEDMIAALVKLYEDNASTLTPDPLHSSFYDSHPPASLRVGHLLALDE